MRRPAGAVVLRTAAAMLAMVLAACAGPDPGEGAPAAGEVRVAAASDLQFAMAALIDEFRLAQPQIAVTPTFGSSGNFYAQIRNGAPFDLYLSADLSYPQQLADQGLAAGESLFTYAVGRVVVWVRPDSPLDVERRGMDALLDPQVRRIAIANPEHAPYGIAAEEAMRSYGIYDDTQGKLVLGENVSQAAQFVDSGAADAGIIALSLAAAPSAQGSWFEIPADRHGEIRQGGAVLASARDAGAALQFQRFLTSPAGRRILADFGFVPPGAG